MKYIYNIEQADSKDVDGIYSLVIETGKWIQEGVRKGAQRFVFSHKDEETIIQWISFIEFAKSKCIYNDFTSKFGQISFPLNDNFEKNHKKL